MKGLNLIITKGRVLLFSSLLAAFYWFIAMNLNVYEYAIIGVIYELLWIFMLGSFILIPIFSIYFWIKEKAGWWSSYFYATLISIGTFLYVYYY